MEKRHLTYEEAAAYLGVAVGTVQAWVCRKQIPHKRLGPRLVRFDPADLDDWLRERTVRVVAR